MMVEATAVVATFLQVPRRAQLPSVRVTLSRRLVVRGFQDTMCALADVCHRARAHIRVQRICATDGAGTCAVGLAATDGRFVH